MLDMNVRLDWILVCSSECPLGARRGLMMLCGRQPCCSDAFHMSVMNGSSSDRNFFSTSVGMGSSVHAFGGNPMMDDLCNDNKSVNTPSSKTI